MTIISLIITIEKNNEKTATDIDVDVTDDEFPLLVALYNDGFPIEYYEGCRTICDSDMEILADFYGRTNKMVREEFKDEIKGGTVSIDWPFNACLDMDNAEQIKTPENISHLPQEVQVLFNKWNKRLSEFKEKNSVIETKYRSETHINFVFNKGLYTIWLSAFGDNQQYYDLIRDIIECDLRDIGCRYVCRDDWQDYT